MICKLCETNRRSHCAKPQRCATGTPEFANKCCAPSARQLMTPLVQKSGSALAGFNFWIARATPSSINDMLHVNICDCNAPANSIKVGFATDPTWSCMFCRFAMRTVLSPMKSNANGATIDTLWSRRHRAHIRTSSWWQLCRASKALASPPWLFPAAVAEMTSAVLTCVLAVPRSGTLALEATVTPLAFWFGLSTLAFGKQISASTTCTEERGSSTARHSNVVVVVVAGCQFWKHTHSFIDIFSKRVGLLACDLWISVAPRCLWRLLPMGNLAGVVSEFLQAFNRCGFPGPSSPNMEYCLLPSVSITGEAGFASTSRKSC